ncbi:hypothetical protein LMG9964_03216 [Paraburkholderia phenoliruptrix]|uniref:Uncharacterized protein n=1 Tax=Paraburkholderia phenoliruptrix TaxID=252970 RepID=A0A6J5K6S8_9BURK|nr:hypothetical protein LMG9964_03216 [Paraburkholderia phenoliruptrix]
MVPVIFNTRAAVSGARFREKTTAMSILKD